ncbi:hypothetical protein ALC57_01530 [Trachymyrmex cornetzi]|uniref:Uncharacterized protein n=1 Tax=Trachymyrmex cornetzi TaxID=471704 RepID=A0A151JPN5_9HYME|nr:hypothetical protein ALC57_01530 [Trachymyrmex cornetzi]
MFYKEHEDQFKVMDEMFNKKPWMTPILTLDSSNPTSSLSSECSAENKNADNKKDPSSYKTKIRSTRINKFSMIEKMIATTEQSNIERKKMHEEAMSRQDKLLDILEKIVTTQK